MPAADSHRPALAAPEAGVAGRGGYGPYMGWLVDARRRVDATRQRTAERLRRGRDRWPWFDHLLRAYERYSQQRGDQLAAAVTFFGFLSFFPLISLAYAMLGYLVGVSEAVRDYWIRAVDSTLPGLTAQLNVDQIAAARGGAGVIGLAGLLVTGLAWTDAMREALRTIWRRDPTGGGGFFRKKLWDLVVLVTLGVALISSVVVSSVATATTGTVLGALDLHGTAGAGTAVRLLSITVAVAGNTVIFLVVFSRLSGTRAPWRTLLRGALLAGAGFEVLKLVGTWLIAHVAQNPVYASFTLTVGLLVWINLVTRLMLLAGAWTATTDP